MSPAPGSMDTRVGQPQLDFAAALGGLKRGRRFTRLGWGTPVAWLELDATDPLSPTLWQVASTGRIGWRPTLEDVLAEDWVQVA